MKPKDNEPVLYYDEYNPEAFEYIISTHKKVIEYQKSKKKDNHKVFSILIVIDDMADNADMCRHSKLLHALFVRGRHSQISTIVATQKFTAIHPIIRVNASELYVFRLRNYSDLQTFLDELGGIVGSKQTLLDTYKEATDEPFSFLYCRLTQKDKNQMLYINYNKRTVLKIKEHKNTFVLSYFIHPPTTQLSPLTILFYLKQTLTPHVL
jgi:hypothetical protein